MNTPTFASPTNVRWFLGIALTLAVLPAMLSGCATPPRKGQIPSTVDLLSVRPIAVTVDSNDTELVISISEDPIIVPLADKKDLQWFISSNAGWLFDGVVIKDPQGEWEDLGGNDNNHKWKNKHTRQGEYHYTIKFKRDKERMTLDPTIKNQ